MAHPPHMQLAKHTRSQSTARAAQAAAAMSLAEHFTCDCMRANINANRAASAVCNVSLRICLIGQEWSPLDSNNYIAFRVGEAMAGPENQEASRSPYNPASRNPLHVGRHRAGHSTIHSDDASKGSADLRSYSSIMCTASNPRSQRLGNDISLTYGA